MIKYIIILALIILLIFLITNLKCNESFINENTTKINDKESDYKIYFDNEIINRNKQNLSFVRDYEELDNLNDFNTKYFFNSIFKLNNIKFKSYDLSQDTGVIKKNLKIYKDKEINIKDLEEIINKIWDGDNISKNTYYNKYDIKNKELYKYDIFNNIIEQDENKVVEEEEEEKYLYYNYSILNNLYVDFKKKKKINNENYTFCKYFISQKLDFELQKYFKQPKTKNTLDVVKHKVLNRTKYAIVDFPSNINDIGLSNSIIYDKLLQYRTNLNKENFEFLLNYYTNQSVHTIWLHCNVIFDTLTNTINIISIKIIGSGINEDEYFRNLTVSKYKNTDNNDIHCSISTSKECKTPKNFKVNIKSLLQNEGYMCINKYADNEADCIEDENKNKNKGIWDKPCKTNEDCPFYKANQNYDNELGGCVNGYCEFPINMKTLSFTKAENKPVCYNCNYNKDCVGIDCNLCCEEQKNNSLYPNLLSPDYAFGQDYYIRNKETIKNQLVSKGLRTDFNITIK